MDVVGSTLAFLAGTVAHGVNRHRSPSEQPRRVSPWKLLAFVERCGDDEARIVRHPPRSGHALFVCLPLWGTAPGRTATPGRHRPLPVLPGDTHPARPRTA